MPIYLKKHNEMVSYILFVTAHGDFLLLTSCTSLDPAHASLGGKLLFASQLGKICLSDYVWKMVVCLASIWGFFILQMGLEYANSKSGHVRMKLKKKNYKSLDWDPRGPRRD